MKLNVVILAAGKGTRMYSSKSKVLHALAGKSLLQHVVDTATALNSESTHVVVGHQAEQIKESLSNLNISFADQNEQRGTGHAVHQALPGLDSNAVALILYGDVPLTKPDTLLKLLQPIHESSMAVLTCVVNKPEGLGRIIRDNSGQIVEIVEEKDTNAEQKLIREINTGVMAIPVVRLKEWLPLLTDDNAQREYLLTDIVALAIKDGCEVFTTQCENLVEATGVNNRLQLAELERHYQMDQAKQLMLKGVSLADPARLDIRGEVDIAQDVEIDINVILEGKVKIGEGSKIGANCILKNCEIGEGTQILPNTIIEDSLVGKLCNIGPFARIRPGSEFADKVKIGNFVETKKAHIEEGSKVNHLSYIGDSELGKGVNIGAGSITCNYDGANKYKTEIGDNVFVGSNSVLIAPVIIETGAFIGAGSTITKKVTKDHLAVARTKQVNIANWKRPEKK